MADVLPLAGSPPSALKVQGTAEPDWQTLPDRELLRHFIETAAPAAFEALVQRYHRLVLGVASRTLPDRHLIDDVFQATFLVLFEKARSIRKSSSLASWLHGVTRRIAIRAREESNRHAGPSLEQSMNATDADNHAARDEITPYDRIRERFEQQALDEELERLPKRYREPLVLHYLEGLTGVTVAERLSLSVATVEGRLKRGRDKLKRQLLLRGVPFGAIAVAFSHASESAAAASTPSLVELTSRNAHHWASDPTLATWSPNAVRWAGKELLMKSAIVKWTTTTTLIALFGLGGGLAVAQFGSGDVGKTNGGETGIVSGSLDGEPLENETAADAVAVTQLNGEGETREDVVKAQGDAERKPKAVVIDSARKQQPEAKPNFNDIYAGRSIRRRGNSEEKIEEALKRPTEVAFVDNPLHEAVAFLGDLHNIQMVIDDSALEDIGLTLDVPVTLDLSGLTLADTLDLLLMKVGNRNLDYTVKNGVLMITSSDEAAQHLTTEVYLLNKLNIADREGFVEMIQTSTEGDWDLMGGTETIRLLPSDALVVRACRRTHQSVEGLLSQLHDLQEITGSEKPSAGAMSGYSDEYGGGGYAPGPRPKTMQEEKANRIIGKPEQPVISGGFGGGLGGGF